MKSLSLRSAALLLSLIVAFFFSVTVFLLNYFGRINLDLKDGSLLILLTFLVTLALVYSFLHYFVFKPIAQIKREVQDSRKMGHAKDEPLPTFMDSGDEVDDLYREIKDWSLDRKSEMEKLQKLELYRKEFLGNVSHELKTPIFNIQGYIATLLDGGLEDNTINKEYLTRAEKSVDRMISMIGDLEAITQLETGQLELEPEKMDIVALVKEVFYAEEMKATAKGIMLGFKEAYEYPVFVYADKFRIRQVITNLVVNSINYGREYGKTDCRIYELTESVVVEIKDNGPGIAKEHLPRLFERFYRVDKGRSRGQGGTGLGLAIVKHIIEAHGQSVSVTSTEGVGTTFSFSLKKAKE